ncbi:MAG: FAD-dependent oxidoreductase [Gammaproteobacteria bacterium]|nr:FAD-dependent oxidoreductase [Gammaproteobacteria bacterium]MCP5418040.1 FAD-dependent oxidoreductase [Chromatiaceae bacterium]
MNGALAPLDDGTPLPFDPILSAVGLQPRTQLTAAAGLETGTRIISDQRLRTSDPEFCALGNCAESPAGHLPDIAPLLAQSEALAATLTGSSPAIELTPQNR